MAPRNKFTREEMVEAAVRVVRTKGLDSLTAKALAAELGVSTQPVFTCFHTIEEAKNEVRQAAEKLYESYVTKGLDMPIPFYGFGMEYIRFAKEEPELYRLLFLDVRETDRGGVMNELNRSQDMAREPLQSIYHIDEVTADRYFRDMWLVVHSLATLIVTGECPYSEEEIGKILTGFSVSIFKAMKEIPGFVNNAYDKDEIFHKLIEE